MNQRIDLLSVRNLSVDFHHSDNKSRVVNNVSFNVKAGEVVCIIGESGSGKSVMSRAIMGLTERHASVESNGIYLYDKNLISLSEKELAKSIRGCRIGMVFQDPMTSLNPCFSVGAQIAECLRLHKGFAKRQASEHAVTLLAECGINEPERRAKQYPHELSGGMRQRVLIALAVACEPELIIADEPTTALDVTVQLQILRLLDAVTRQVGRGLLLITHDLGVVASMADKVIVMKSGNMIEAGSVDQVLRKPEHPYTQALVKAASDLNTAPRGKLMDLVNVSFGGVNYGS